MVGESPQLAAAREHLAAAEAGFLAADSDYHIDEGFGLLEALVDEGAADAAIAQSLGVTYFERLRQLLADALSQRQCRNPRSRDYSNSRRRWNPVILLKSPT